MEWRKNRGSVTSDAWKGLCSSVLLHAATAAVLLFAISGAPPSRTPLLVDLTIGGPWEPGDSAAPPRAGNPRRAADAAPTEPPIPVPASPSPAAAAPLPADPAEPSPPPRKEAAAETAAWTERRAGTVAPHGPVALSVLPGIPAPAATGLPHGIPAGAPSARATAGTGAGAHDPAEARARGRSPERDYAYIRDAIQRGIAYPPVARKMGWEGKVVVAFLVLPDGSVRDVRVVQGSGHPALDRGAVEAVRNAAPFRRPPAEAEIVTPVVYRLD